MIIIEIYSNLYKTIIFDYITKTLTMEGKKEKKKII